MLKTWLRQAYYLPLSLYQLPTRTHLKIDISWIAAYLYRFAAVFINLCRLLIRLQPYFKSFLILHTLQFILIICSYLPVSISIYLPCVIYVYNKNLAGITKIHLYFPLNLPYACLQSSLADEAAHENETKTKRTAVTVGGEPKHPPD